MGGGLYFEKKSFICGMKVNCNQQQIFRKTGNWHQLGNQQYFIVPDFFSYCLVEIYMTSKNIKNKNFLKLKIILKISAQTDNHSKVITPQNKA